jgi:hypothetical protein
MLGKNAISFLGGSDEGFWRVILLVENDACCKIRGLITALGVKILDAVIDKDLLMRRRGARQLFTADCMSDKKYQI